MTIAEPPAGDAAAAGRAARAPADLGAGEPSRRGVIDAERARAALQPELGLKGLVFVIPIAVALAVAAGGADGSVLVLGPLVTYALPLVVMMAFWCIKGGPSRTRRRRSLRTTCERLGWVDQTLATPASRRTVDVGVHH
jgi:hypothetical protein